jgi:ribosomal subunit interface protein
MIRKSGNRFSQKIMLRRSIQGTTRCKARTRVSLAPLLANDRAEAAMSFRVSGKNLDVGDALRTRINARIGEAMSKYFDGGYSGHMTIARDGTGFRTECAVHLDSKITLRAAASAPDAYASADQAALRVEKRLRRYHRRLKDHRA